MQRVTIQQIQELEVELLLDPFLMALFLRSRGQLQELGCLQELR